MKLLLSLFVCSAAAFGQCGSAGTLIINPLTGLWDCTAVAGAGTGSVTSVGLEGTANEITVTGATPITASGSWTLSLPAGGVTLPGTTTIGALSAKQDVMDSVSFCADAGSTDAYACDLTPAISSYVTGTHYRFKANTANTGAATIAFNSLASPKTIVKVAGGITTTLANNDIRVGQWVDIVYDGTNMQMQSTLGNASAGGSPGGSDTQCQYNNSSAFGGISGCTTDGTTVTLVAPILGAASATSINKLTLTTPATGSTFTLIDGKTLTVNNTLTIAATDGITMTTPTTSFTAARTDAAQTFTGVQTFVAPILGTPTSGNMANMTGLALAGTPLTTKGDLLGVSTVLGRLAVGSDGQVLTADAASTLGFKWAAAGGGVTTTSPLSGTTALSLLVNVDFAFTAAQTVSIATTTTQAAGLSAISTTSATTGAQKYSPCAILRGNGFQTNTSGSMPVDWCFQNRPIQGAAAPSTTLDLKYQVNNGGYSNFGSFYSTGSANSAAYGEFNAQNIDIVNPAGASGPQTSRMMIGWILSNTHVGLAVSANSGETPRSFISYDGTDVIFGKVQDGLSQLKIGNATGIINRYGNIATVSNGVPSELATIDLTGQTAAKGSTTLYTPTATGFYRFSYVAKVTTPGTTSILGGTAGLVLSYTDGTDSVAVTMACSEFAETGNNVAIATGNALNTTAALLQGSCTVYALTGVAINYTFGYTSTGTAMQYALRGKLEAM